MRVPDVIISGVVGCSLPEGLEALAAAAEAEGFGHLRRLARDWDAASFSAPGESLRVAHRGAKLVGIGGITADPFVAGTLRMRRFYVLPEIRGQGVGRQIAERLMVAAGDHAGLITVNAGPPGAAGFWERLGFAPVEAERHTHELNVGARHPAGSGITTARW